MSQNNNVFCLTVQHTDPPVHIHALYLFIKGEGSLDNGISNKFEKKNIIKKIKNGKTFIDKLLSLWINYVKFHVT
jgi:hypothetical protein